MESIFQVFVVVGQLQTGWARVVHFVFFCFFLSVIFFFPTKRNGKKLWSIEPSLAGPLALIMWPQDEHRTSPPATPNSQGVAGSIQEQTNSSDVSIGGRFFFALRLRLIDICMFVPRQRK